MLDGVAEALSEVEDVDLDGLSATELNEAVERFQRLRAKLEAAEARVVARWDAQRCWRREGAKTGPAWLAWKCRLPMGLARQRVRHARALRDLPEVARAWGDGEIDRSHLTTLLGACNPRTADAFATDHKELLDVARTCRFVHFRRACDMWVNLIDSDGAEQSAAEQRAAREVHLSQSFEGMWFGRMTFDPVSGTIVSETLSIIEAELFDADWADATERLGREPLLADLARTPAQRRADAMAEMAMRARTAPEDGRRPTPLFTILLGYETFAGPVLELHNRTVVTPGTAAAWLSDADIERIVFDGPSRVVDVGARRRFYRGALRRAIEVRDRTCFHPTCDEVPQRPEIDHIDQAANGGPTTQANGRLACAFHNKRRNHHPDDWEGSGGKASPDPADPDAGPDPPEP